MFAGASLDENSGAFCELKANFFRLILTKAELLALTPADFDFTTHTLRINKSYQRLNREDVITPPKTFKSNRFIKMPQFICDEMQDYMGMLYGLKEDERIFTISKSYLHHEMNRGSKVSGVKRIRVHDLRHSHVSLLINMGLRYWQSQTEWDMRALISLTDMHICFQVSRHRCRTVGY